MTHSKASRTEGLAVRWHRLAALVATLSTLAAAPLSAHAAGEAPAAASKHVVGVYTEGPRLQDAQTWITDGLGPNAEVATSGDLKKAFVRAGQRLPLGITIGLDGKRDAMVKRIGAAATGLKAEAMVLGITRPKRGGGTEMLLLVIEAGKSSPSIDKTIALGQPGTAEEVKTALAEMTGPWEAAAKPPVETTDTKKPDEVDQPKSPDEPDEPSPERPINVYGHEIFSIQAAFSLGGRFFDYSDGLSQNLRSYDVFGAPGAAFHAEVYPLATTGVLILKDLGITGEFRTAFGISSATKEGEEVGTTWMRFGGGLRYRLPVGPEDKPYVFGLRGSVVKEGFTFDTSGTLATEVPSTDYLYMRVGLDARIPLGPIALTAFGGYLGALSAGEVHERFRDPSVGGIDVGGGVVVPIAFGFEAFVQAEYIRWFYAFAPVPGDAYVAGGALDQYIHIEIGPQYVY